jgi:hypothetical protein
MDAIAATIDASRIELELGAMCQRSLFFELRQGASLTQAEIDHASQAFITATERLMPPAVVHGFIEHACRTRILPQLDAADLVPGFTADEALAFADAELRAAHPMKKFTQSEVLACLAWNQRFPAVPVALAHLIELVQTYAAALANFVERRSPAAAAKLGPFVSQWSPKNVMKFLNLALYVSARAQGHEPEEILPQERVVEAMTLLHRSGAFTWLSTDDAGTSTREPLKIHCPAQAFLHKLLVNQGSLVTVLEFVRAELGRTPVAPELTASEAFVREAARREAEGVRAHGPAWAQRKLGNAHG